MNIMRAAVTTLVSVLISGCGQGESQGYAGIPEACTESYEQGFLEVCNAVRDISSNVYDQLRQENQC